MHGKNESKGVFFTILSAALWGVFPIIIHFFLPEIPKFFFAAVTGLLASLGTAIWAFSRGKFHELRRKEAYLPLFMVGICIVFIPNLLLFWGASLTSAINTSVLMLSEMIFTLIFTPFFGEKNTLEKYIGSLGIFIGAILVLYKNTGFSFNVGDILIILSTVTFPIGNFYSKRSLYIVSPSIVIMVRYFIGGILLLFLSFIFEPITTFPKVLYENWVLFFFTGFILLTLCKVAFYEGMRRLDISKVISLEMTYPFFSLLVLYFFLGETVTIYQILGVIIMVLGAFYAVKRKSVQGGSMKYIPRSLRMD